MIYLTTVAVCMFIGAAIGIISGWDWIERVVGMFTGVFWGAVTAIPIILVTAVIMLVFAKTEYEYSHTETLHSLKDSASSESVFFLGTGGSSSSVKYYFIAEREKGLQMDKVSIGSSYIIEDNSKSPQIKHYKQVYKSSKTEKWFGNPLFATKEYVITIPKDSVTQEFVVDME